MIAEGYGAMLYPSTDLNDTWRSNYIDSTYNTAGVQDPAIDYLVDGCVANQDNEKALLAWGHALDRVLTWNYYVIPEWYLSTFRVAYWNRFSRPAGAGPSTRSGSAAGGWTRTRKPSCPRSSALGHYILRRLLLMIPTLWAIITINFFIVQIAPGGPVDQALANLSGPKDERHH